MSQPARADREAFERLVALIDYPMFVVTTAVDGCNAGCLVGFATQVSIDPARFLVCLSRENRTFRVFQEGARWLGVHFLRRSDDRLAELFGGSTGDETDKFAACSWEPGPEQIPILSDCGNWFVGKARQTFELGDHVGILLEPRWARQDSDERDFSFHRARRIEPGHEA